MRASVVIATRNRLPQLQNALPTVIASVDVRHPGIEIIVVDDGSTDGTIEYLRKLSEIARFKIVRLERSGGYRGNPSAVLNRGHLEARGDVIIEQGGEVAHLGRTCIGPLLDHCRPGTVALARVHNGTTEEMNQVNDAIRNGSYPYPRIVTVSNPQTNGDKWRVPRVDPGGVELYCGAERPAPFLFCGAIHRKDFERVGGYDERLPRRNDQDLAERLVASGVRFTFVGDAVAFHLRHGKS